MTAVETAELPVTAPVSLAPDTFLITNMAPAGPGEYLPVNSLLIRGDEPVIVDTGAPIHRELWRDQVFDLVAPEDVRWVFLSHDDGDHTGALHEALASARIQSVPMTRRDLAGQLKFPSSREEWLEAERLLAAAVKEHGPPEATLRLARVRGRLGKHEDAAVMLRDIGPRLDEPALQYFGALFLGSEEAALGRADVAREALERAASLFPTAQSPLLALADVARREGNRTATLAILGRLQRLPADAADREDPWTDYHRSFAGDAATQLDAVRAWVGQTAVR